MTTNTKYTVLESERVGMVWHIAPGDKNPNEDQAIRYISNIP